MTAVLPLLAAAFFLLVSVLIVFKPAMLQKQVWLFPAALSVVFAAFSLHAVSFDGILGFWTEHTRNAWGNQIWFDLLFAIGIGWYFAVPKARALGMRPVLWLFFILCTGSIGLLAMVARLLYLETRVVPSHAV